MCCGASSNARVAGSRPHLVTIYGDAGVGKSRLTREFLDVRPSAGSRAAGRSGSMPAVRRRHHVLAARGDPEGPRRHPRHRPAGPRGGEGAQDRPGPADPGGRGRSRPRHRGARLYGRPRGSRDLVRRAWTPGGARRAARGMASFFTALALAGPVIVVIEDIHWADPVAAGSPEELAERVEGPVMFLCPSRPDLDRDAGPAGAAAAGTSRRSRSTRSRPTDAEELVRAAAHGGRPPAVGPRAGSSSGRRGTPSTSRRSSGG